MMKKFVLVVLMLCGMLVASASYADGIDLKINDASVREAAAIIATKGHVHVIVDDSVDVKSKVSMNFTKITPMQALMMLTSTPGLAVSWDGNKTYLISKLSKEASSVLRNAHPSSSAASETSQRYFNYDYPLGSHVQLKNVSVGNLLLVIATSCRVGITISEAVDESETIQQIDIQQMTPEVALKEFSKATGLIVTKTKLGGYLVAKNAADTAKMLERTQPSMPSNPWERFWPYFIQPLAFQ